MNGEFVEVRAFKCKSARRYLYETGLIQFWDREAGMRTMRVENLLSIRD